MSLKALRRIRKDRLEYGHSALLESGLTLAIVGTILLGLAMVTASTPAMVIGLVFVVLGLAGVIVGYLRLRRHTAPPVAEAVERDGYWHRYSLK